MQTKKRSRHAQCAADIKAILKRNFPNTAFSVKSESYAGGDSVRIAWNFGPTVKQVEALTQGREHGHFDGMTDMYEYTKPGVEVTASGEVREMASTKFLFTERNTTRNGFSDRRADAQKIMEQIAENWGYVPNPSRDNDFIPATGWAGVDATASNKLYRVLVECSFLSDDVELLNIEYSNCVTGLEPYTIFYKDNKTGKIHSAKRFKV